LLIISHRTRNRKEMRKHRVAAHFAAYASVLVDHWVKRWLWNAISIIS